mgnify:CR=1 FL=1
MLGALAALLPAGAAAQQSDARQRTTETIVADGLAQLPAADTKVFNQVMGELAATGSKGVEMIAAMLVPADKGKNATFEYALNGVVAYVTDPAHEALRDDVRKGLLAAIDRCGDDANRAFLFSQLQFCSTAADAAAMARYLDDPYLADYALRALVSTPGTEALLLAEAGKLEWALEEFEYEPSLGNGGLGRLAACFLDSMATLELPSWGYGMRYEYGMFAQSIINGAQVEHPDSWLVDGTPWEFPRPGTVFPVRFGGTAEHHGEWAEWNAAEAIEARAFDYVIPGHGTNRVSTLRLWKAGAPAQIDLNAFNSGDYARAAEFKNRFENISWVLYPNDTTPAGRELRLRQRAELELATLASTDPLTGLANRAAFRNVINDLMKDETAQSHSALLFLDGDNFKLINDNWGHAAGDKVLIEVASRLMTFVGKQHQAWRLGGDEFALLLPDCSLDAARLTVLAVLWRHAAEVDALIAEELMVAIDGPMPLQ